MNTSTVEGVSINDLRRNRFLINTFMEEACRKTAARYGVVLDAALITNIDPPGDVDEALASINTTQNQVAASISQAKADTDQKLKMAEQAVQIAQNRAEAAPILELGHTLAAMHATGGPHDSARGLSPSSGTRALSLPECRTRRVRPAQTLKRKGRRYYALGTVVPAGR